MDRAPLPPYQSERDDPERSVQRGSPAVVRGGVHHRSQDVRGLHHGLDPALEPSGRAASSEGGAQAHVLLPGAANHQGEHAPSRGSDRIAARRPGLQLPRAQRRAFLHSLAEERGSREVRVVFGADA